MRPGETEHTQLKANVSTLKRLNFKYLYTLKNGLDETIDWYRKNLKHICQMDFAQFLRTIVYKALQ